MSCRVELVTPRSSCWQRAASAEWQTARGELAKLEAEHAQHNAEIKRRHLELPWVPVEKKYEFETEAGRRTLADLFEGRSQLLAYNIVFGPDYKLGACPGCSNLVDHLDVPRCTSGTAT